MAKGIRVTQILISAKEIAACARTTSVIYFMFWRSSSHYSIIFTLSHCIVGGRCSFESKKCRAVRMSVEKVLSTEILTREVEVYRVLITLITTIILMMRINNCFPDLYSMSIIWVPLCLGWMQVVILSMWWHVWLPRLQWRIQLQ